jgi:hypothetical protein
MKTSLFQQLKSARTNASGKLPLLLLWLVGVPVPILVIIFLLRGCS